jgi:hypothetical protein
VAYNGPMLSAALPSYFWPLFALGFPVFFSVMWVGILMLIAKVSGYRSLLAYRTADARRGTPLPTPRIVHLGGARYKGKAATFTASPEGLGIHMMALMVFHPDLRVPWDRVEIAGSGPRGVDVVLDGRVHMHVPQDLADAIARARPR